MALSMEELRRQAARAADALRPGLHNALAHLERQGPHYVALMRLNRPIGIFLLLWPTWWALLLAGEGLPDTWVALVFTLGVVLMRSAGCVINDYADRDFDAHVRRTRERPLASGRVTPREALVLFGVLVALAFLLVLTLNRLTLLLSVVAVLLAVTYPFTKRYTYLPQFHLGLAFGWSVPMAFAAQTNELPATAWLLLAANVLWSVAYDTMYAMVDREDDIKIGVKSTAILFADMDRHIIGAIQLMMLLALIAVGTREHLHWPYYVGLAAAGVLMGYHQHLIRDRDPEACLRAFLHNNWVGMAVFLGLAVNYLLA